MRLLSALALLCCLGLLVSSAGALAPMKRPPIRDQEVWDCTTLLEQQLVRLERRTSLRLRFRQPAQ